MWKTYSISSLSLIKNKMLNLIKLLPSNIRSVRQYQDIIKTYQSYLYNDVFNEMLRFKTRFNPTTISDEDIMLSLYDFGHNLSQGDGYTSTSRYLRREFETLIKRIRNKGTEPSYQYLFYVFDLIGEVFPLLLQTDGSMMAWTTWLTSDDLDGAPFQLDAGHTLDEPTGGLNYWNLDAGAIANNTTRHFLISFIPRYIENATQFISVDTMSAFFNDVSQNKRKVEIPHYEYRLYADASSTGIMNPFVWADYTGTLSFTQQSVKTVASASDFSGATYIRFGNSARSTVDSSITDVQSFVQEIALTSMDVKLQDSNHLYFKNKIFPTTKLFDYSEIAVMDSSHNCIFYSKFPEIVFDPRMLSGGYWFFTLT